MTTDDISGYREIYREALEAVIEAKAAGRRPPEPLQEGVRKAQSARGENSGDAEIHEMPESKQKEKTAAAKTAKKTAKKAAAAKKPAPAATRRLTTPWPGVLRPNDLEEPRPGEPHQCVMRVISVQSEAEFRARRASEGARGGGCGRFTHSHACAISRIGANLERTQGRKGTGERQEVRELWIYSSARRVRLLRPLRRRPPPRPR
ncbi:hypothetical protein ACIOTI_31675 [Streptomyces sp. NPDC087843]|uniref:hypothetical protein n=1 Tax=Streptomyces sp. NPDC087843 TaxID=3365804 RepID=UPI00382A6953